MDETAQETQPTAKLKIEPRDLIIATTVVVATLTTLNVAARVVAVPLTKLTDRLNRKTEELKKAK